MLHDNHMKALTSAVVLASLTIESIGVGGFFPFSKGENFSSA